MRLLKKLYILIVYPLIAIYIRKERPYAFGGFQLTILPGVFHPRFFFSTKFLFAFIDTLSLNRKKCLELGCGSGLLSLLMLRKGAEVTAVDIQKKAVLNTTLNIEKNSDQFITKPSVLESDLFQALGKVQYDVIIINPPYFFDKVQHEDELPWYCGENGEYFHALFNTLPAHLLPQAEVYMILADTCDIERIKSIARNYHCELHLHSEKKIWWEHNYIMRVRVNNL